MAREMNGAWLEGVIGLTLEQLDEAVIDEKTILPIYLQAEQGQDQGPK
jgi:hypothetical protein